MIVIHKYEVFFGQAKTNMPPDANVRHVAAIQGRVYVWAATSEPTNLEPRPIGYFATGEQFPDDGTYLGTAVTIDGAFVWHVIEGPR